MDNEHDQEYIEFITDCIRSRLSKQEAKDLPELVRVIGYKTFKDFAWAWIPTGEFEDFQDFLNRGGMLEMALKSVKGLEKLREPKKSRLSKMWERLSRLMWACIIDHLPDDHSLRQILDAADIDMRAWELDTFGTDAMTEDFVPFVEKRVSIQKKRMKRLMQKLEALQLHYWPHGKKQLSKLYDLLLASDLIRPNENWMTSFQSQSGNADHRTVWMGQHTQLVTLVHLIYDLDSGQFYKGEKIEEIAAKLFRHRDGSEYGQSQLYEAVRGCSKAFGHPDMWTAGQKKMVFLWEKLEIT